MRLTILLVTLALVAAVFSDAVVVRRKRQDSLSGDVNGINGLLVGRRRRQAGMVNGVVDGLISSLENIVNGATDALGSATGPTGGATGGAVAGLTGGDPTAVAGQALSGAGGAGQTLGGASQTLGGAGGAGQALGGAR